MHSYSHHHLAFDLHTRIQHQTKSQTSVSVAYSLSIFNINTKSHEHLVSAIDFFSLSSQRRFLFVCLSVFFIVVLFFFITRQPGRRLLHPHTMDPTRHYRDNHRPVSNIQDSYTRFAVSQLSHSFLMDSSPSSLIHQACISETTLSLYLFSVSSIPALHIHSV
jgi:hypothetical protein